VSRQKRSGLGYDLFRTGLFHPNQSYVRDSDHGHCISVCANLHVIYGARVYPCDSVFSTVQRCRVMEDVIYRIVQV
jgi:hypothetical protein